MGDDLISRFSSYLESLDTEDSIFHIGPAPSSLTPRQKQAKALYEKLQANRKNALKSSGYQNEEGDEHLLVNDGNLRAQLVEWLEQAKLSFPETPSDSLVRWNSVICTACYANNIGGCLSSEAEALAYLEHFESLILPDDLVMGANAREYASVLRWLQDLYDRVFSNDLQRYASYASADAIQKDRAQIEKLLERRAVAAVVNLLRMRPPRKYLGLLLRFLPRLIALTLHQSVALEDVAELFEFLVESFPVVRPWNVLSFDEPRYTVPYLRVLFGRHPSFRRDPKLALVWFTSVFSLASRDATLDVELKTAIKQRCSEYAVPFDVVRSLCQEKRYVPGLLLIYQTEASESVEGHAKLRRDSLQLLIHYGSIAELREYLLDHGANCSDEDWESIFTYFLATPSSQLSNGAIVDLLVKVRGPQTSLRLLGQQRQPWLTVVGMLPPSFYLHAIQCAAAEREQEQLVYKTLEQTNNSLWESQKLTSKSAQFRELQGTSAAGLLGGKSFVRWNEAGRKYRPAFDHGQPLPRFLGETTSHWGVAANIFGESCEICSLPLEEMGISLSLAVFPCGHAFHQVCVPESACRICHSASLTSLRRLVLPRALTACQEKL